MYHFVKRSTSILISLSLFFSLLISPYHLSGDENLISLDVRNMDINSVLKIIAEQGGLNIIASKNVKGNISAKLKDIPVEQALKEILEINGFVYEKESGIIRVMTEQEYIARYGKRPGDETKVFVLKYADISKLAPMLNQVKTKTGKVIPDIRTNTVVVIDRPESIAHIESMIKELDIEVVSRTFELKHAEAAKIGTKLQKIVSKEGKVHVDEKTNKITVHDVARNVELITMILQEWDVPSLVTRTFILNYAKPEEVEAKVSKELTKDVGIIQVDGRTNSIVVTDRAKKVKKIASLISTLDTKTKQILIEVKIIEATLSDEQKLGINWQYQSPETRPQEHHRDIKGDFLQGLTGSGGIFKIGALGKEEYAATLEMLRDSTDTNIISSPRLITLNNQTAKIVVGTEYPIATYQLVKETGTYEITGWELLEYGITVEVTPTVNEDNFITMTINPQVSDAVGTVGEDPHERPIIETQEVTTQTMIKDGETIVIAGLIKDKKQKTVKKIPLLGSIPILGVLFRKTSEETTKTDLIIFITAHIIESESEALDLTSKGSDKNQGKDIERKQTE